MSIAVHSAIQFVYANARLLDRRRLEYLMGTTTAEQVIEALRAYQNADGGFGHALEPDMRAPGSEPAATLLALETLVEIGVTQHPMIDAAAHWVASAASPDGTLPQMSATGAGYPHAPFINPGGPTFLTFALAGVLWRTEMRSAWLDLATEWCWRELQAAERPHTYTVVFALRFLDAVPDADRACGVIDRLRSLPDEMGCIPVPGGLDDERVTPLDLSPQPGARSRRLFTSVQIAADLDRVERTQLDDGGWDFDFLHWSAGQALDWRGSATVSNLQRLLRHDRITLQPAA
ncbi:hypothetical protein FDG2_5140 [Candidatus Protofrankia californiensis]|uniref:Prenyltransferase/squalene oxidase n=1 Tax=Candidatus Protofrankia californiensis TaxID=1839754 RepID=A0A1C3PB60_9ACTN|nr:hypothetical protein FDG2_5140 [Candidatus Protofrankia californiensis]